MKLKREVWQQLGDGSGLWLGETGVLINTAALEERTYYADIVKVVFVPPTAPTPAAEAMREVPGGHA